MARRSRPVLPPGSAVHVMAGAGHFLRLERPPEVGMRVREFLTAR
ncbi:hypothetical protein [Rhodococcus olei]